MVKRVKNFGNWWPTSVGIGLFSLGVGHQLPKFSAFFYHNSEMDQDINLKFSAIVYHMSWLNCSKNMSYCSIIRQVAPSTMQKLWTPLATVFVEKNWKLLTDNFHVLMNKIKLNFIWILFYSDLKNIFFGVIGNITRTFRYLHIFFFETGPRFLIKLLLDWNVIYAMKYMN